MPEKFFITTSIAYANGEPHAGFAMELIQADTIARWQRQRGASVHFLTGTDEHGAKLARAAAEQGTTPLALTTANSAKFRALRELLDLSWDDFIRTTDQERHWPAAQQLWQRLRESGRLERRSYAGLYCVGCEEFKREIDLVDDLCPNHQKPVEQVSEENWFFRLSDFGPQILQLLESGTVRIVPEFRSREIINVVRDGLHDISFSRPRASLDWGIPVPDDPTQVMYVWCDALTNYISAVGYGTDPARFAQHWPATVQVIGKDIVRFHAGIWLGMLLAAELPLPREIFVHGFITSEGQKMSKSLGNVVDPVAVVQQWGSDALRYYLLSEIPVGQDGDFGQQRFREKYEADLANGLGNLLSRVVAMALKLADGSDFALSELDPAGQAEITRLWQQLELDFVDYDFRRALLTIWQLVEWANRFIDTTKPWELKNDPVKQKAVLSTLLEVLRQLALALYPFLPSTAERIAQALGVTLTGDLAELQRAGSVATLHLSRPQILFPKQDPDAGC